MSILSDTLDSMISKMATLYPTAARLANPYSVELNPDPELAFGYGVIIGSGSEQRSSQSSVGIKRRFSVVQTREYIALDSDPSSKEDVEKLLIDDQMTLLKDLEVDFTLGEVVQQIAYVSDSGIQSVSANQKQFLKIETQFSVIYIESLT